MKPILRTTIIILSYVFICFIGCLIFAFVQKIPSSLVLPHDLFGYKFLNGFLYFIKFLPSICCTGILIGFSWSFQTKITQLKRFSKIQLGNLKKVLLVGFVSTFFCFVSTEVLLPIFEDKQTQKENDAHNYVEYIYYANLYKLQKDYNLANFYVEKALELYPDSEGAISLSKEIEYRTVDTEHQEYNSLEEVANFVATYDSEIQTTQERVLHLLEQAENYYSKLDYFNAHYYATQAQYLSEKGSLNEQTAKDIAADSWNMISSTESKYNRELAELYAEKKRGYVSLLEEDYINAYYIFDNLAKADFPDEDILFYKDVAEFGLLNSTFFTDETESLQSFESSKNIYFTINNADGTKDVVYIKGLTVLEDAGQLVQYFRNFFLYKYDSEGNFLKSIFAPYAKMIAVHASSFGNSLENTRISKSDYVPYILLKSVDRHAADIQVLPTITYADNYFDNASSNSLILEMPYSDFSVLRQASKGPEKMSIFSLFGFSEKATEYGYSSMVYSWALTKRVSYPLFLMILFICLGLMAWNYRLLYGRPVAFRWIFVFPLINAIAYFALQVLNHFGNIFFFTLFSAIGAFSMYLSIGILILGIFIFSLVFLSSRGE